jgi:hypothetical protein
VTVVAGIRPLDAADVSDYKRLALAAPGPR